LGIEVWTPSGYRTTKASHLWFIQWFRALAAADSATKSAKLYLPQSQLFPQLHSLLSFIGQFLPVFLQLGLSAAIARVQIMAARNENRILVQFFINLILAHKSIYYQFELMWRGCSISVEKRMPRSFDLSEVDAKRILEGCEIFRLSTARS
jgi:hypothetical protein